MSNNISKATILISMFIVTIIIVGVTISSGVAPNPLTDDHSVHVVVSIPPQAEMVEEMGKDEVKVTIMVPQGEDPHTYDPEPKRLEEVSDADLYFKVGSGLEFEERHMDTIKDYNEDIVIIDGSKDINLIDVVHDCDHEHDDHEHDDHENRLSEHDIDHACHHMIHDEREILEMGFERGEAIEFTETHQPYEVELTNEEGYISFEVDECGKYAYFTDEKDVLTPIDGVEKHHEENIDTCEEISEYYVVELEEGENKIKLSSEEKTNITILVESVELDDEHEHDEHDDHEHHKDPHIWLSPNNTIRMTENLLSGMVEVDPDNSEYYKNNAEEYTSKLTELNEKISTGLADYTDRKFLIYHPSLGYFAEDYDLEQIAIEEEGKIPSGQELQNIIDQAREENISIIFVSPQFDQSAAESIADEIDGEVISLNSLTKNHIDNLENIYEELKLSFD